MTNKALTETLEVLKEETKGDKISIGDIVEALNHRGFGPLLIGPSLLVVMPTGAIPGIPSLCALLIILIAAQIAFGRRFPWIPSKLKKIEFEREKYETAVNKVKPYTKWVDSFFQERLQFLTRETAQRIIAAVCVILALCMIPLELIPFASFLPASAILIFGLSLSVRDGLIASIGFAIVAASLYIVPNFLM
mgnify:CR=1 FL=1